MVSENENLAEHVASALREVIDPELGINIVDLGLVYGVHVEGGLVTVDLTMTTAACPLAEVVVDEARRRVEEIPGLARVDVRLVWDPPWSSARLSSDAKKVLGWPT